MFEFATAARIVFGPGSRRQLPELVAAWGRQVLLVTGANTARHAELHGQLQQQGLACTLFSVDGEPSVELVQEGVALARRQGHDVVVAIGGGSAMDAGKAIAALTKNPGDPLEYLEVIGQARPLRAQPLPFIAVPTTSGTGAEVTKNAVLSSKQHRVKVSLRSEAMLPKLALVDSELTHSVPRDVTAATGLDALTQVLEPYVSRMANPLTDALAREGIARAGRALTKVYHDGLDADAREDMALVSLLGGLCLANAKLGAVHGLAGPIGGMFDAPHGAVCARLLPLVMEANLDALHAVGDQAWIARFDEAGRLLTGDANANASDAIARLRQLGEELQVPALSSYGMSRAALPSLVDKARRSSSMRGNPVELSPASLSAVLEAAL